jgi:hypothetical protein
MKLRWNIDHYQSSNDRIIEPVCHDESSLNRDDERRGQDGRNNGIYR